MHNSIYNDKTNFEKTKMICACKRLSYLHNRLLFCQNLVIKAIKVLISANCPLIKDTGLELLFLI